MGSSMTLLLQSLGAINQVNPMWPGGILPREQPGQEVATDQGRGPEGGPCVPSGPHTVLQRRPGSTGQAPT